MEDESCLFHALLDHSLKFWITSLVQDYSREQIIDQTQEKGLIFINLKIEEIDSSKKYSRVSSGHEPCVALFQDRRKRL